jgi:DNA replication and repair protein RecF
MYLQQLSLLNFKNIRQADLAFCAKLNCLTGDNGAGKTNLVDAIHSLSLCRSASPLTDGQCVCHEADFFTVEGCFSVGESREEIACAFKKGGGKVLKRNGKEYEKLSEHVGLLPVVLVSPSDTSLINESGEDRRKYLNALLSQLDKGYLQALIRYNRVLAERNKLLKQPSCAGFGELLEVFDLQLSEAGTVIHRHRRESIDVLAPVIREYYAVLSGEGEAVEIAYRSALTETPMEELLRASLERDRMLQHTTEGIHRDDLRMTISGYPLRKYGSQGQQKSFLVALKLAQFEIIEQACGRKPILLLDDVFDKLDLRRVERLIRLVSDDRFGQIFVTDSNKVRLDGILDGLSRDYKRFAVRDGEFTETGS